MNSPALQHLILEAYASLLRIYPPDFRASFESEMQDVFSRAAREAYRKGPLALVKVLLIEICDLPVAALREHALERRSARDEERERAKGVVEHLSQKEMLVALAVFLIPAGFIILNTAPSSLVSKVVPPLMLVLLLFGSVTGLIKRFPRWSLPYFGLVVSGIFFLFLFQMQVQRVGSLLASSFVHQPGDELSRLLLVTFWDGVVWFSVLAFVALTLMMMAHVPRFHSFILAIWDDWTRLSYLFYGCSMLALALSFEGHTDKTPFALAALLCMATGAWGYLRSSRPERRFLALMAGLTLAMGVTTLGDWLLASGQDWKDWFQTVPFDTHSWFEAGLTLIGWAWMVVVMAIPRLLKMLPKPRISALAE